MRDEFLITRNGKQYVLFPGLLDEAYNRGLRRIDTELIQVDATVELDGPNGPRTFSGIGDAGPDNVSRVIAPHTIRMSETRAKARALRDAVNVGATPLEELSDEDNGASETNHQSRAPQRIHTQERKTGPQPVDNENDKANTTAQPKPESERSSRRGPDRGSRKARKSQVDLLTNLAVKWRGDGGVERLENRLGMPISELTTKAADDWIQRLTTPETGTDS